VAGIALTPVSSLRPVRGTAEEILELLRAWNDEPDDPEPLVVETSGSSGRPKRVRLSRRAMRASAEATAARLGGHGQWLLNLPPAHVAGLQVLFRSVLAGTEPVVTGPVAGHVTGPVADVARMTGPRRYVSLVPTQLHRMLDQPSEVEALRSFSTVLVGGAAVPAVLRARAAEAGIRTVTTYGMSETCGGCVYDGYPLDGVAVKVDAEGRVLLAGPVLFDGYDDPARTAEVLDGGWLRTQDLGRLDEDGRLEVLGRVDDVVISGGVNVDTAAVARRLEEHPRIELAAVVGVPDDEWGHAVVAVVQTTVFLDSPAMRDFVAAELPRSWAPRRMVRTESMPMLPNGKIDYQHVRRVAAKSMTAPPPPPPVDDD
jgi:o-succinylbenzoate---CoA ligase